MVKRLIRIILSEVAKFRQTNVRFLPNSYTTNSNYEGFNSVGENSKISSCFFGTGTYTGRNTELSKVKVGRYCSIGSFVRNITGRHPSSIFVSTHPSFFSTGRAAGFTFSEKQKFEELKYAKYPFLVEIGNDVWIGDNVSISDGVKIGDGAIIGSNSLVMKDVDPYSINVGLPSKPIKYRFDREKIDKLLLLKWWEKDHKWIKDNYNRFENIVSFFEYTDTIEDNERKSH